MCYRMRAHLNTLKFSTIGKKNFCVNSGCAYWFPVDFLWDTALYNLSKCLGWFWWTTKPHHHHQGTLNYNCVWAVPVMPASTSSLFLQKLPLSLKTYSDMYACQAGRGCLLPFPPHRVDAIYSKMTPTLLPTSTPFCAQLIFSMLVTKRGLHSGKCLLLCHKRAKLKRPQ